MKELANFYLNIPDCNLENYSLPPEDPLGELSKFEFGLRRFCYECNHRVVVGIGKIEFPVFFDPDICILLEDGFPEKIGQLEQGQTIRIDFVESYEITVILTPEGELLNCQLLEGFKGQNNQYEYKLNKEDTLEKLRIFLFQIMGLAFQENYIDLEDIYEFVKPSYSWFKNAKKEEVLQYLTSFMEFSLKSMEPDNIFHLPLEFFKPLAKQRESLKKTSSLYEQDFYGWTQQQAKLLREGTLNQLDLVNLAEEIESFGKQQRQELRNRLGILLGHLLKWEFQPSKRSKSWFVTLREQRREIGDLLAENPSLKPYLPEALQKGYQSGIDLAVRETSLSYKDFPTECPYTLEQVLETTFFPGEPSDLTF